MLKNNFSGPLVCIEKQKCIEVWPISFFLMVYKICASLVTPDDCVFCICAYVCLLQCPAFYLLTKQSLPILNNFMADNKVKYNTKLGLMFSRKHVYKAWHFMYFNNSINDMNCQGHREGGFQGFRKPSCKFGLWSLKLESSDHTF